MWRKSVTSLLFQHLHLPGAFFQLPSAGVPHHASSPHHSAPLPLRWARAEFCQGAVCFVSPTICSICFVSANLWSIQGASSFGGCRSPGTGALPGKPMQNGNQESFFPFCSHDFSCKVRACCLVLAFTALCFSAWALSEGAVGRWKRRGKSFWSIFAFLPTEGFESLSSSAVSGNVVFVGDEGCVCTVKMALWMLCRVQPMVLHMAHFPEDTRWNAGYKIPSKASERWVCCWDGTIICLTAQSCTHASLGQEVKNNTTPDWI